MYKKGVSVVITVFLIVLLSVVLAGVLWAVVKNLVLEQSKLVEDKQKFFSERVEITRIRSEGTIMNVTIKNIGGEIAITVENQTQESAEADVFSVVDLSGSMRFCEDVSFYCCYHTLKGSWILSNCYGVNSDKENDCITICSGTWVDRLSPLQDANYELVNTILESEDSRVGLIGYESEVEADACLDLTDNIEELNSKINSWEASGSTCICCGINDAAEKLESQSTEEIMKTIIVMSDGDANIECEEQSTGDAGEDAVQAACDANQSLSSLTIYSIGVGDSVNEEIMEGIATCGNGEYFPVEDIENLTEIYTYVAEKIKKSYTYSHQFNYLLFVFYNSTNSYKETASEFPQPLGTKEYSFNLEGKIEGEIIKIEIYPVFIKISGKEVIGPLFDYWEKS